MFPQSQVHYKFQVVFALPFENNYIKLLFENNHHKMLTLTIHKGTFYHFLSDSSWSKKSSVFFFNPCGSVNLKLLSNNMLNLGKYFSDFPWKRIQVKVCLHKVLYHLPDHGGVSTCQDQNLITQCSYPSSLLSGR